MTSADAITLDAILKVVEILSIIGGGGLVVFKMGRMTSRVEASMTLQATDIKVLKDDVKVVGRLLTDVAGVWTVWISGSIFSTVAMTNCATGKALCILSGRM